MSSSTLIKRQERAKKAAEEISAYESGGEQALHELAIHCDWLAAGKPLISEKDLEMLCDENALDLQLNAEHDLRSPHSPLAKEARSLLTRAYFEEDDAVLGAWLREALKNNSPNLKEVVKLAKRLADGGSSITTQGAVVKCYRHLTHSSGAVTWPKLYEAVARMLNREKDDPTLQSQVRRAVDDLILTIQRIRKKACKRRKSKK